MITIPCVSRAFVSGASRFDLDIPAIEIAPGELVYVTGPNGSGKSVYLRTLANDPISGGPANHHVRLDAVLLRQEPELNLAPSLTTRENLALWKKYSTLRGAISPTNHLEDDLERAEHAFPSLRHAWDRNVETLSGGQKQSIALLSRTFSSAKLLLLDEITSAIDAASTPFLLQFLADWVRTNQRYAIIVAHDMHEIYRYSNRLIVFSRGRIFRDIQNPENSRISVEELNMILFEAWKFHIA